MLRAERVYERMFELAQPAGALLGAQVGDEAELPCTRRAVWKVTDHAAAWTGSASIRRSRSHHVSPPADSPVPLPPLSADRPP